MELTETQAIGISLASIAFGWLAYDLLCRSPLGRSSTGLMVVLFVLLVAMAWGHTQVFSGRAAMLHLGAFTATIMSANVFMVIIPNQKKVVAILKDGQVPDAKYGAIAKQRSTHNNYLTLPVIFLMLSNHYPLAFATPYNWLIASLVFLMGVTIRHFFNTMHAGGGKPWWTWGATAALFAGAVWLSSFPATAGDGDGEAAAMTPAQQQFAAAPGFETVTDTVLGRCSMCHASEPAWDGITHAPKNILLETPAQIAAHARDIFLQSGHTRAMPPANVSYMEDAERQAIVAWYRAAVRGETAGTPAESGS
jgi:uncharacterized membrane protein